MPVMDGYEASLQIRKNEVNMPLEYRSIIIGLTAHSTESYKNKCFASGMDDFSKFHFFLNHLIVTKPVDFD